MKFQFDQIPSKDPWTSKILEDGFPHSKNEDFFYFPLAGIPKELSTDSPSVLPDISPLLQDLPINPESLTLVVCDGQIQWEHSSIELKNYLEIQEDFSEESKKKLKQFHWDYFKAVSLLKREEIFRFVLKKESIFEKKPLQIILIQTQRDTLCVPHFEIIVEKQTYVECQVYILGSDLEKPSLHIPYFFIHLQDSAEIKMIQNISTGKEQFIFPYFDVYQDTHSIFNSWTSYLKGFKSRIALGSFLAGEQAKTSMKGLYLAYQKEQCEIYTRVYHTQPYTFSNQLFKGICGGGGHFSFNGDVIVSEHAKGVEAYQLSKNMILDKDSKVFTRPQLHVSHHELKCTHGSTIGGLNPEELLYLQSRGISLEEARYLSMIGFLDEVTNTLPLVLTQQWVKGRLTQKLGQ